MIKKAETSKLVADHIKLLFEDRVLLEASKRCDAFNYDKYASEHPSSERAQFCIDYVRNMFVAYLEEFGFKSFLQDSDRLVPTQEELDTFNDPSEVVKQAIIDKANSISIQDIYDYYDYTKPYKGSFRYASMNYVIDILLDAVHNAIDAFYASQPVCGCYED